MSSRHVIDVQSDGCACEMIELRFGILIAAGERYITPITQNGIWKRMKIVEIHCNKVPQVKKW
jgi:hypothetical protein